MTKTSSPDTSAGRWLSLLRGLVALVFGIYLTFSPAASLIFLAQLAAAYILVDGVLRVLVILTGRAEGSHNRRPNLIMGIVGIVTGAIILGGSLLGITFSTTLLTLLVIILGAQLIVLGGIALIAARETEKRGLVLLLSSMFPIALGLVLVAVSLLGVSINIVRLIGLIALVYGGILIWRGFSQHNE